MAVALVFGPVWPFLADPGPGVLANLQVLFLGGHGRLRLVGGGVDLAGTLWTFDYALRLLQGAVGIVNPEVYAPVGFDQGAAQGFAWLDAFLAAPLVATMGPVRYYNLYLLLLVVADYVALHLLFRRAGAPRVLALGLALAITANPFLRSEIWEGRSTQVHLVFHAIFLMAVVDLLTGRGRAWLVGLWGGLALAAACYVYWFSAIAVGLAGAVAAAAGLAIAPRSRRALLVGGSTLAGTALLAALGPTWRLSSRVFSGEHVDAWYGTARPVVVRLLGVVDVETTCMASARIDGPWDLVAVNLSLGVPLLLLCVGLATVGFARWSRAPLPWVLAALSLWTLPMGGVLEVGDGLRLASLHGALGAVAPFLCRCHTPGRMVVGPLLALALAVAAGGGVLEGRWREGAARLLGRGGVALLGLLLAGATVARPVTPGPGQVFSAVSIAFLEDATGRWPGGIVDVPLSASGTTYYQQIFHRQVLFGGPGAEHVLVRPRAHVELEERQPVLRYLRDAAAGSPVQPDFGQAELEELVGYGFRVLVVHPRSRIRPDLLGAALGLPVMSDGVFGAIPLVPTEQDWTDFFAGRLTRAPPPASR